MNALDGRPLLDLGCGQALRGRRGHVPAWDSGNTGLALLNRTPATDQFRVATTQRLTPSASGK